MNAHGIDIAAVELDLGLPVDDGPEGWVLLIAPPETFHAPLCEALEQRGFGVVIRSSLEEALDATRAGPPRCFVCDGDLEDGAGLDIARALRENEELGHAPIVCLTSDESRRVGALATVADAALSKDSSADVAAAQIDALVRLADRLDDAANTPEPHSCGLAGDLAQVSLQTLLDVLSLERRTGTLEVVSGDVRAELHVVEGCVVTAALQGNQEAPLAALRATLACASGRFSFSTGVAVVAPSNDAPSLRELALEALRLVDEEKAAQSGVRRRLPARRARAKTQRRLRALAS